MALPMEPGAVAGRSAGSSSQIKVLTLNCWGLKYVSAHRVERVHAIADFLASSSTQHSRSSSIASVEALADPRYATAGAGAPSSSTASGKGRLSKAGGYDVVALQELWVYKDFLVIRDRAKEGGLIYSKWFHSAALGAGVAILSRYPIRATNFLAYSLNGYPLNVIEGDFFVGKAVGSCVLDVPVMGEIEVFTTHLFAPHDVPAPEWKRAHRTAQAWELSKLVLASVERGRHVFVCGDLNSVPSSLPIQLLLSQAGLNDAWKEAPRASNGRAHNGVPDGAGPSGAPTIAVSATEMTYQSAIKEEGITCDSMVNTFTAGKNPNDRGAKGFGKRLDYILFRPAAKRKRRRGVGALDDGTGGLEGPGGTANAMDGPEWEDDGVIACDDCHVTLTDPIPVLGFSYSDHFALEATFTISPSPLPPTPSSRPKSTSISTGPSLATQHLSTALSALSTSHRESTRRSRSHLLLFLLCLLLVPGLSVSASFQPLSFLNWIFTLLSVCVGALGATMLYVGWVAGRWERNALRELCEEMEVERERLSGLDRRRSGDAATALRMDAGLRA